MLDQFYNFGEDSSYFASTFIHFKYNTVSETKKKEENWCSSYLMNHYHWRFIYHKVLEG